MLLILTNSIDTTADVLANLCEERGQALFRFNIDLWLDYQFAWVPSGFAISDPSGRTLESHHIRACLWRRPTLLETPSWRGGTASDRVATEAELHSIVREMADWTRARHALRLIDPWAARRVGRLAQMRVAGEFFPVPEWQVSWGYRLPPEKLMVKRFNPQPVGPDRDHYIYVSSVDADRLSPEYPWLTQKIGRGIRDSTVLYVNGTCFGFEMCKTRAEYGIEDWRTLRTVGRDAWRSWPLTKTFRNSITAYMERLGLKFGRLDFLSGDDEPTFLEVNPNGQFSWLDDPDSWPLHNAVLSALLEPSSTVFGNEVVHEKVE